MPRIAKKPIVPVAPLRIYHVSRLDCVFTPHSEVDAFIVAARSDEEARHFNPAKNHAYYPFYVAPDEPEKPVWPIKPESLSVIDLGAAGPDVKPGLILTKMGM